MYLTRIGPYGSSNMTVNVTWPCHCWHRVEAGGASRPGYHFDSCGAPNHNKHSVKQDVRMPEVLQTGLSVMEERPRTIDGFGSPVIGNGLEIYHRVPQLVVSAL